MFLKPALLTMPLPSGVAPVDVLGFGSAGDGSDLHLTPRTIAGGTITLELWHFSTGGASSGGASAAAAMQGYTPSAAESAALQRIGAASGPCEAELTNGIFNGPACAFLHQEQVGALRDWYANAVKPQLDQAVGAPAAQVEQAMAEWLQWKATVESTLNDISHICGPLVSECDAAAVAATRAVQDLALRRLQSCDGTALANQLRDVSRVADFVDAGAIDLTANNSGLPDVNELPHECAHLKIDVTEFPTVAALLYANTLRGRVTVDVRTGPDRTDVPFTFTVDGSHRPDHGRRGLRHHRHDHHRAAERPPRGDRHRRHPPEQQLHRQRATRPSRPRAAPAAGARPRRDRAGRHGLLARPRRRRRHGRRQRLHRQRGRAASARRPSRPTRSGEATAVYTAPTNPSANSATVTATLADGATASSTITIQAPITVTVSPTAAILSPGGTAQFSATVTGTTNTSVTWSATGGSISQTGLYTAGSAAGSFSVTATSVADPTVAAAASVQISASASIVTRLSNRVFVTVGASCISRTTFASVGATAATLSDTISGPGFPSCTGNLGTASLSFTETYAGGRLKSVRINQSANAAATPDGGSGNAQYEIVFRVATAAAAYEIAGPASVSGDPGSEFGVVLQKLPPPAFTDVVRKVVTPPGSESVSLTGTLQPGDYKLIVYLGANAAGCCLGSASGSADITVTLG